ncbi:hypothetical protein [Novosphingobium sp. YAF33]|uniref:hypothetical protein n=1 Tax=Novosphingobium sp. YAF33 TaxID=3233082 RepID=UPI003F9A2562
MTGIIAPLILKSPINIDWFKVGPPQHEYHAYLGAQVTDSAAPLFLDKGATLTPKNAANAFITKSFGEKLGIGAGAVTDQRLQPVRQELHRLRAWHVSAAQPSGRTAHGPWHGPLRPLILPGGSAAHRTSRVDFLARDVGYVFDQGDDPQDRCLQASGRCSTLLGNCRGAPWHPGHVSG